MKKMVKTTAVQLLNEPEYHHGVKIRRQCWEKHVYIVFDIEQEKWILWPDDDEYNTFGEYMFLSGWEIYEEELNEKKGMRIFDIPGIEDGVRVRREGWTNWIYYDSDKEVWKNKYGSLANGTFVRGMFQNDWEIYRDGSNMHWLKDKSCQVCEGTLLSIPGIKDGVKVRRKWWEPSVYIFFDAAGLCKYHFYEKLSDYHLGFQFLDTDWEVYDG